MLTDARPLIRRMSYCISLTHHSKGTLSAEVTTLGLDEEFTALLFALLMPGAGSAGRCKAFFGSHSAHTPIQGL
jgi:hypothetical protein